MSRSRREIAAPEAGGAASDGATHDRGWGSHEVERRSGQVFDSCTSPRDAAARLVWAIEGPVPAHLGQQSRTT